MPTRNTKNKLHCQHCGKLRVMMPFMAIDTEVQSEDGKPTVIPFNLKTFKELIQSKAMYRLPHFYAGVCTACGNVTYYQGQNRKNKLQVIPT